MKIKLAVVIPSLTPDGAERVIINILRNINLKKFEVTLILVDKRGGAKELIPASIPIIQLNVSRVRYSIPKLVKTLNSIRPDIIFSTLGHMNLLLLFSRSLLRFRHKIIVREANTPSEDLKKLPLIKRMIFRKLYAWLYPKADIIVAQCKAMKMDLVKTFGLDEAKIVHIYNPIDLDYIRRAMVAENPYKNNRINVLAVGRLTRQKGFDILIEAFQHVAKVFHDAHLTILGQGELKEELESKVAKLGLSGKVSFEGFKKNPYPYYRYADVYVLSSRWEGFPNSLLEALACGCKVVATDCKSGPREILGDNEYGILVPPEDPEALARGIIEAINGENRTKDRAKDFDVKYIVRQYEEIFEMMVDEDATNLH